MVAFLDRKNKGSSTDKNFCFLPCRSSLWQLEASMIKQSFAAGLQWTSGATGTSENKFQFLGLHCSKSKKACPRAISSTISIAILYIRVLRARSIHARCCNRVFRCRLGFRICCCCVFMLPIYKYLVAFGFFPSTYKKQVYIREWRRNVRLAQPHHNKTNENTEWPDFQRHLRHLRNACFPTSNNCCSVNENWDCLWCVFKWKGY